MKGVILAGGLGSRLAPLTMVTNKHLLPVYDKPMIYYPLENLAKSGIEEVMVVTGGRFAGHFLSLLQNGKHFGLKKLEYAYQEGEGGIADALKLARSFIGDSGPFCVVLGDNIYQYNIKEHVERFEKIEGSGACVLSVPSGSYDPMRFGIAASNIQFFNEKAIKPEELIEKPGSADLKRLGGNFKTVDILTGTYFYTPDVFDICEQLKPSKRGELEITDVNKDYLDRKCLDLYRIEGWWSDAGTFPSLLEVSNLVRRDGANLDVQTGV